jgi:methylphosphotriester-DNA--protein-cysteine methyltransferase
MIAHDDFTKEEIRKLIADGVITLGGNRRLKIYGLLTCASGKKMKKVNRVFFSDEQEAIQMGFRPCGHCMYQAFAAWRKRSRNR